MLRDVIILPKALKSLIYLYFFTNINFFNTFSLNIILFFIINFLLFIVVYNYFLKKIKNINQIKLTFLENWLSFFIFIIAINIYFNAMLDLIQNNDYLLYQTCNNLNKFFLILFILIMPITFILLIKQEKLSIMFCSINFLFLLLIVLFIINTNSLLGLIMGYELVFLPSFLIMRKTVYSASAQSAYSVFTVWSVLGSLIVVAGAIYIFLKINIYSFTSINLTVQSWTDKEIFIIALLFFLGFGVKIPIWPFHYWLTRVHVEASTGFSIFLSGFLVKVAVFVCWKTIISIGITVLNPFFMILCLFSVLDGALKLSIQTDIKKLVAFATVFEMGLIFFFLLWKPIQSFSYIFIFCFTHAFLSGLMFYIVDLIYSRLKTRNIMLLSGLAFFYPGLSKIIWIMLFIFWGLPFSIKFFIELWVLLGIFNTQSIFFFILIIFILAFANIFVTKIWFNILYGAPIIKQFINDLNSWEYFFSFYLIFMNTVPALIFWNLEL